jgi:hypothetical protein
MQTNSVSLRYPEGTAVPVDGSRGAGKSGASKSTSAQFFSLGKILST